MNANKRFVFNMMSRALLTAGVAFLPSAGTALLAGETAAAKSIGITSLVCLLAGGAGRAYAGAVRDAVRPRIWYMTTFFIWLMICIVTVPAYWFGMPGCAFEDAVLSSCAGWTTTGMCVFESATVPASISLLRATCSWLGGIGLIMVILTIVPSRQFIGWGLASTEFPGPTFLKSDTPFKRGYKRIVLVYLALTAVEFVLLVLLGMPGFTALLTALSGISTAGLPHISNGMVAGLPGAVKAVISVFTLLGSLNCTIFLLIISKRFAALRKTTEIKMYILRILATAVVITLFVVMSGGRDSGSGSVSATFADSLMQMISVASTSGYMVTDTSGWPVFCVLLVMVEMFIGACSVSTGGGLKEARAIIAGQTIEHSLFAHIHPGSVRSHTFNQKPMKTSQIIRANIFIALFMITWLAGALLLSLDDITVGAALAWSQAVLTNAGTSVAEASMSVHPAAFSPLSKYVMCVLMIAGRLEIYPFIMIFLRSFWKPERAF